MEDLRCTQCNHLLGKNVDIRYGEFKCPRCKAINIIDRDTRKDLTGTHTNSYTVYNR